MATKYFVVQVEKVVEDEGNVYCEDILHDETYETLTEAVEAAKKLKEKYNAKDNYIYIARYDEDWVICEYGFEEEEWMKL